MSTIDPTAQGRDPFGARVSLGPGLPDVYRLDAVAGRGLDLERTPVTLKILLENLLRHAGRGIVRAEDVDTLLAWRPGATGEAEIPFMPARVILQDFTGVPAVVDLASMRDAMAALGGDPARVNPLVPADLVIDHSVQVDAWGTPDAFAYNAAREYERNGERYQLLRWAQTAFRGLRVVPPGTGIVSLPPWMIAKETAALVDRFRSRPEPAELAESCTDIDPLRSMAKGRSLRLPASPRTNASAGLNRISSRHAIAAARSAISTAIRPGPRYEYTAA